MFYGYKERILKRESFIRRNKPKKILFEGQKYLVCYDKRMTIFNQRPNGGGVYFFTKICVNKKRQVLYIGSCKRFQSRLSCHEKIKEIRETLFSGERIEILCFNTKDYNLFEKYFINKYQPFLNKNYKK